jgi:hypothetical protein
MEYLEVLLVFRIWRSQRLLKKTFGHHSTLFQVMIVVIESAAICSSALIAAIATYAAGGHSQFIIMDLVRCEYLLSSLVLNHIIIIYSSADIAGRKSAHFCDPNILAELRIPGYRLHLHNYPSWTWDQLKRKCIASTTPACDSYSPEVFCHDKVPRWKQRLFREAHDISCLG